MQIKIDEEKGSMSYALKSWSPRDPVVLDVAKELIEAQKVGGVEIRCKQAGSEFSNVMIDLNPVCSILVDTSCLCDCVANMVEK